MSDAFVKHVGTPAFGGSDVPHCICLGLCRAHGGSRRAFALGGHPGLPPTESGARPRRRVVCCPQPTISLAESRGVPVRCVS